MFQTFASSADFGNIGNAVIAIVAVVGALGGAVGYFAKNRGDQIIKYQAIEIDERDKTIARLEKDNAALQRENEILHDQNSKLWERAQGNPQLKKLTQAIATLTNTVNAAVAERRAGK
jgi:hypothetical protein